MVSILLKTAYDCNFFSRSFFICFHHLNIYVCCFDIIMMPCCCKHVKCSICICGQFIICKCSCRNHMLEDGCIDQKVHSNSFIITIPLRMLSAAISPSWNLLSHGVHCRQQLHQKLLSKTSTNGNHQVLVLLASSDLESDKLPWTKLVNRMWLQHNLVFQVEYIKEEQCWLSCNCWGCCWWLVGTQLSFGISCCYC